MISQLTGAFVRAFFVVVMVLTPSLLLPDTNDQIAEATVLVAIFAAVFVVVEYGATYPGLIEFRGAPPINRVRFGMLFVTLLLIAIACSNKEDPALLSRLVGAVGSLLGHSMDFAVSPIRLILWLLPEGTSALQEQSVRAAAGLAYLTSLFGLTAFAILIRVQSWPSRTGTFNVWINLPTFDPTAGTDVVKRLNRDGAINIVLGFVMPYLTPLLGYFIARSHGVSMLDSDLMMVWVMALWAFLPTSLFLRGIAMRRLAMMIEYKRRRFESTEGVPDPGFLPA